ncbi:MAG: cytochrome P450 [Cyclobacteriaceae bacterium]
MTKLWDPYGTGNRPNPYPMYDRLREVAPVYRSQSGDIVITGYQEVKTVLLDHETYRVGNRYEWIERQVRYLENREEELTAIMTAMNSFLVQMNGHSHKTTRALIVDAWDNKQVNHIIENNIDDLLSKVDGDFDLIQDFAAPLPVMTMANIMGMPLKDYQFLKNQTSNLIFSLDMYTSFKTLVRINEAAQALIGYFNEYITYRSKNPSDDLTSKIIALANQRDLGLTNDTLISICIFLFMAGEETTINLIGTGAHNLMLNRDQLEKILNSDQTFDDAIDEALRFESPVHLAGRIANSDSTLAGIEVKKSDTLTLCIGAANRDPRQYPSPHLFDIGRKAKNHLAFGAGLHFCLGSWLARIQWKIAIKELFNRFQNLDIQSEPEWNPMLSIRGLKSLHVTTNQ